MSAAVDNEYDDDDADLELSGNSKEFLTVIIADQRFGIPILQVQDVLGDQSITNIPKAPPEVAGALNLRGRVVTAIDVRKRLGIRAHEDLSEVLPATPDTTSKKDNEAKENSTEESLPDETISEEGASAMPAPTCTTPNKKSEERIMSVVVEHEGELYSLLIDDVGDVLALKEDTFETNPPTLDPAWKEISLGIFRLEKELLIILDVPKLLDTVGPTI